MKITEVDVVGVGIGPSNLSLAALLYPISDLKNIFFDKRSCFQWHEGIMLPNVHLQLSYLKDLVTLVDPTNPFSFLSFLRSEKRIYQFINANYPKVSREEFNQYYQWVSRSLPNLHFNNCVRKISIMQNKLAIHLDQDCFLTEHVVLGCGLLPFAPHCVQDKLNDKVFHSSQFKFISPKLENKRIVVIGGGQSGAEIVKYILGQETLPEDLKWVSRRNNFLPLDDSPFVNELFTPAYSNYFLQLPINLRYKLIKEQKLFSDGISLSTLEEIYRKLYEIRFIQGKKDICHLMPNWELIGFQKTVNSYLLSIKHTENNSVHIIPADIVILCTGYRYQPPDFLEPLLHLFDMDRQGNFNIREDYSLVWNGPSACKIFLQNGSLYSRGIADPNLSLSAWRSAGIINSIAKKRKYDIEEPHSLVMWDVNPSIVKSPDLELA